MRLRCDNCGCLEFDEGEKQAVCINCGKVVKYDIQKEVSVQLRKENK